MSGTNIVIRTGKHARVGAGRLSIATGLAAWLLGTGMTLAQTGPARIQPEQIFGPALESAAAMPRLHSLLISHDSELILERYFNGRHARRFANVKSVSKSIISALVGIAIARGHIESVEQPIADFFADELNGDDARAQITVDDLLTMQAGLETTSNRNYGAWVTSANWIEFALNQPLVRPPGTRMQYSTGNTHLLSAIITRATGMDTLRFARATLAGPLGFELPPWPKDPQGVYFGGNDMELTPRQMLAFGQLYMDSGSAGGRQIVPAEWVQASLQERTVSPRGQGRRYGYGWWIRDMAGFRTRYAWGFGGQFVLLVPELDLVIVTTSSSSPGGDRRSHTRRIYDLVEFELIAPFARSLAASPMSASR